MSDDQKILDDKVNIHIQRRNLMYFSSMVIFTTILNVKILPEFNLFIFKATIDKLSDRLPIVSLLILFYFIIRHHHERSVSKESIAFENEYNSTVRIMLLEGGISELKTAIRFKLPSKIRNLRFFDLNVSNYLVNGNQLDDLVCEVTGTYSYKHETKIVHCNVENEVISFNLWDVIKSKIKSFIFIAAYRNHLIELYFPTFYGMIAIMVCLRKMVI